MQSNDEIVRPEIPSSYTWWFELKKNSHVSAEYLALLDRLESRVRLLLRSEHGRVALWQLRTLKREEGTPSFAAVRRVYTSLFWRVAASAEKRSLRRSANRDT